jgi:hypothetical protein
MEPNKRPKTRKLIMASTLALALAPLLMPASTPVDAQGFVPTNEKPQDYPEGPGRDQTFYMCTACHGFKLVAAQSQTRAQWEDTLDFMTRRHNMPKLEGADREVIVGYLAATFPQRAAPRGAPNPFLKK